MMIVVRVIVSVAVGVIHCAHLFLLISRLLTRS
jgi:hypothetical protein